MNRFSEILPPGHVLVDLVASSRTRVFDIAAKLFAETLGLDSAVICDSLLARERLGSTGLGAGVAIPHARIQGLSTPTAAVLQLRQPVAFQSPDQAPVSLMFFLLVPESATQEHLQLLSAIATLLSDDRRREAMKACASADELRRLLDAPLPAG